MGATHLVDGQPSLYAVSIRREADSGVINEVFDQLSRINSSETTITLLEGLRDIIMKKRHGWLNPSIQKRINLRRRLAQLVQCMVWNLTYQIVVIVDTLLVHRIILSSLNGV